MEFTKELKMVIDSFADGIYITDGQGYTLFLNKAYERITGLKKEDLIGKHMGELEEKGIISQSATLMVLKDNAPINILQEIVKTSKIVLVTSTPFYDDDGNIIRVITNVRDMTKLKALENELKTSKELTKQYQLQLKELEELQTGNIIIRSPVMMRVYSSTLRVAPFDTTVLIQGESGVGKEVIARKIHENSKRSKGPFIKINCGAIPENLLESELFGYEKGAFTGSNKEGKIGLFELADQGTLLLDEIGELPLNLQVKLLHFIQDKEIKRVGGIENKKVDVRLLAATNKDLKAEVAAGNFRKDLFYRLNVVSIQIPPLRDRRECILGLLKKFIENLNYKYNQTKSLTPQAIEALMNYYWPGNVRELENVIEHLFVMSNSEEIGLEFFPKYIINTPAKTNTESIIVNKIIPLKEAKKLIETELIKMAVKQAGSFRGAAKLLKVDHSTLIKKQNRW